MSDTAAERQKKMAGRRKVIQIAVDSGTENRGPAVWALCDDGTIWSRSLSTVPQRGWQRIEDVPQDQPRRKASMKRT